MNKKLKTITIFVVAAAVTMLMGSGMKRQPPARNVPDFKPEPLTAARVTPSIIPCNAPDISESTSAIPTAEPEKPMIALTFDDGPSGHTPKILDLLEQCGGRATFCVIGSRVKNGADTITRANSLGCEILGHSWDHKNLTKLSEAAIREDLLKTNAAIEALTGNSPKLYRPPYGAVNDTLRRVSGELGFAIIGWSVDTRDWKTRSADAVYKAIMEQAGDRAIILCHDLHGTTAQAMERVIPELTERGYRLVTVSELFGGTVEAGKAYWSAE